MISVSSLREQVLIQSRLIGMTSAGTVEYRDAPEFSFLWVTPVFCGSNDIEFYYEKSYTKKMMIDLKSPSGLVFQALADLTTVYITKERNAEGDLMSRISTSSKKGGILFACPVESFQMFNQLWDSDYSDQLLEFQSSGVPETRTLSEPIRYAEHAFR